jgi:leader peptidase (prepilin peptidase)/N-methyltransferase
VTALQWPVLAMFGLLFGSLASALSYRLPRGLKVAADRSRCPACEAVLTPRDLIPLASWLLAKRRCRHCGAPVSWRYPALETGMAVLFVAAWAAGSGDWVRSLLLMATAFGLVVIVVADLEQFIVPDAMVLFLVPVGLLWRWRTGGAWVDAGLGAAVGLGISLAVRQGFQAWRGREALGLGDVKLFGVAGLFVGISGLGALLTIAGATGMVFGVSWRVLGKGALFPFAPAICLALAIRLALDRGLM